MNITRRGFLKSIVAVATATAVPFIAVKQTVLAWYYKGKIYDVRVYNRALTPKEIKEMEDPVTRWDLYH